MPSDAEFLKATREGQLENSVVPQPEVIFERRFRIDHLSGYNYSYWALLRQNSYEFVLASGQRPRYPEQQAERAGKAFNVEVSRVGF